MSITYDSSVTVTSSTLRDAVVRESNNQLVLIEGTTPSVRIYDMSTKTQVGSNYTVSSSPKSISLVNSASAVVFSDTVNSVNFVELDSGYVQTVAGSSVLIPSGAIKGQLSAGNLTAGIALAANNTTNRVTRAVASSFSVANVTVDLGGGQIRSIINVDSNTWIAGTTLGQIIELNSSGVVTRRFDVTFKNNPGLSGMADPIITGLSYSNDILRVLTISGVCFTVYYPTGDVIYTQHNNGNSGTTSGSILCQASSGITLESYNSSSAVNQVIVESHFATNPYTSSDVLFLGATGGIISTGINNSTAKGYALQLSTVVYFFDITPPSYSDQTCGLEYPASTGVDGEYVIIQDDGVGSTSVKMSSAIAAETSDFPVPTGQTIRVVGAYETGVGQKFETRKNST